jgi:hypothetical protein
MLVYFSINLVKLGGKDRRGRVANFFCSIAAYFLDDFHNFFVVLLLTFLTIFTSFRPLLYQSWCNILLLTP